MAVNDPTAFSRPTLFSAVDVLTWAQSIRRRLLHRGLRERVPLYRIPVTSIHQQLRLQWAHEHRIWQDDWH
ncbi:hypothetical protein TNCV_2707741 [Trichonephila clavipes]|nr:hypothetical protein TNCV_2707741 [Trichonephila clavipes]